MIDPDRQSYLITRALAIAIELLSVLPEDIRPDSDISDLKLIYGQQNDGGLAAHNQAQARKYINMLRGTAPDDAFTR